MVASSEHAGFPLKGGGSHCSALASPVDKKVAQLFSPSHFTFSGVIFTSRKFSALLSQPKFSALLAATKRALRSSTELSRALGNLIQDAEALRQAAHRWSTPC